MKESNKAITLAIYPFENLADGTIDTACKSFYLDLVTELSRFRQFRIVTPSGVNEETSGDRADYIIKGSFRLFDQLMRINAQLIKSQHNEIVWADHFEGPGKEIITMQKDLLSKVAASLQQQLNYSLITRLHKTDASAYEFWLYGMEELKKGSVAADAKAREYFTKAIEIDPGYSLAYSGMSMTFFNEWSCRLWERWEVSKLGAYEWAKKAIDIDNQNYIAAVVLGRTHLYEGNYDLSEHYLRRGLRLNPNDIDSLIQIASCFVFLGYTEEADEILQRVLELNPLNADHYRHIESFIALELGDFSRSIDKGRHLSIPWLDFNAFLAAAYYHAGDIEAMQQQWNQFVEIYEAKIGRSATFETEEVVNWLAVVNPYRGKSFFGQFLQHILGKPRTIAVAGALESRNTQTPNCFRKKKDWWEVSFFGEKAMFSEVKGFYDLARMLASPEKDFHCTELMGSGVHSEVEFVFDDKAKRAYRKRLSELREELEELELQQDYSKKASVQREHDALVKHLTASLGLGGKTRRINDPADKVRSAVTWRIRKAIQKIDSENQALGKHLSRSVKTGLFCSYKPETPLVWEVDV